MESSDMNRFTPGGNPEMGNPSTSPEVAKPRSDSGEEGGSISLSTEPTVDYLAVGTTPKASRENKETANQARKGGPGSISSRLEEMEIGEATNDEHSIKGSNTESMDSDVERELLNSEIDTVNQEAKKIKKKELTADQKARKAYRNAQSFLKKISRFEAGKQPERLETITEEVETQTNKPAKRLQRSNATEETPKTNKSKPPTSEKKTAKWMRSSDGVMESEAKRAKPSISFDSSEECQIAIIDRSDLDGRMTAERWMEVESRVLLAIAEMEGGSGEEVDFEGAGWWKGVKVMGCSSRKSRDFLTQVISKSAAKSGSRSYRSRSFL